MNTSGPQTTAAHPSSAESNCLPLPCAFGAAEASDSIGGGEQKKNSNTYVSTESGEVQTMVTASPRTMRRPYAGIGFPSSRGLLPPSTTLD